jgi:hypothetical protein
MWKFLTHPKSYYAPKFAVWICYALGYMKFYYRIISLKSHFSAACVIQITYVRTYKDLQANTYRRKPLIISVYIINSSLSVLHWWTICSFFVFFYNKSDMWIPTRWNFINVSVLRSGIFITIWQSVEFELVSCETESLFSVRGYQSTFNIMWQYYKILPHVLWMATVILILKYTDAMSIVLIDFLLQNIQLETKQVLYVHVRMLLLYFTVIPL